ncbi:MAG: secondary thiamine-phosphate synthase enzyme YjbQ [Spirochaetia bacterium]
MVFKEDLQIQTQGFSDIKNITAPVQAIISKSGIQDGMVNIFSIGSTQTITVIEYEPALVKDIHNILEKLISRKIQSHHSETWGDDNGFSHMRGTLFGCETTAPVDNGKILLGTWQQIVLIDHDNRPRNRQIRITVVGE